VGVNAFVEPGEEAARPQPQVIDPEAERSQAELTRAVRAARDPGPAAAKVDALGAAARGTENLLPRIRACVEADVTLGEIADALRAVWGEHRP
jgi:methylmalonyl-CoA mutase N-terminal domain/subunit